MPAGRPSEYTPEIGLEICRRLSEEEGGLTEVLKADDMPGKSAVYVWLGKHPEFAEAYARAREDLGVYVAHRGVKEAVDAKDAQLGRLQFDARKWLAAKLAGKQFGDKVAHVGGGEGDAPIRSEVNVTGFTPEQLAILAGVKVAGE